LCVRTAASLPQDHARIFAGVEQVEQASAEMVRVMSSALEGKPSSSGGGGGGGGGSAGMVDIVGALRDCIPPLDGYGQYCANQVRKTPLSPELVYTVCTEPVLVK